MLDMSDVIIAKSDQINAPDLTGKPRTVKIAGVRKTGKEQAVEISMVGEEKVWRPCKSMVRIMTRAWGIDGEKWVGQSATLYCDPTVRFGKDKPGGIRISHLSGLRGTMAVCLQASKGVLKTYEIEPLTQQPPATVAKTGPEPQGEPAEVAAAGSEAPKPKMTPQQWAAGYKQRLQACETIDALTSVQKDAQTALKRLLDVDAKLHGECVALGLERMKALIPPPAEPDFADEPDTQTVDMDFAGEGA